MKVNAGERWRSTVSDRCFAVVSAEGNEIVVDVERSVKGKDGESKVEVHRRAVPRNDFPSFSRVYKKEK